MKTKVLSLILGLMLVFAFAAPVSAEDGYTAVPGETPLQCVEDYAGILSYDELETLDDLAIDLSATYGCGIYVLIVEDYESFGYSAIDDYAADVYLDYDYGLGSENDGVMLVLSMAERDYALFSYGSSANYAFSSSAIDQLSEEFLDDFSGDNWYNGLYDYIVTSGEYIEQAIDGDPVGRGLSTPVKLLIAVVLPLLIALVVCLVFRAQMKPVKKQKAAKNYLVGGVDFTERNRMFNGATETRTPLPKADDFKGGGGGFSGKTGKF